MPHSKESKKKYAAAYYEAHKEELKTYQVAYREANREKIKARKATYHKAHAAYYKARKEELKTYQVAYREANREKIKARKAAYHKAHGKEAREYQAAHRHGLSELDILAMRAAQSNRCACCDEIFTASPNVDHDHHCCEANRSCDKCRRGLLCSNCNRGLGMFRDSIERLLKAVEYLKRHAKNHLRQQHEIIESDGR